MTKLGVGGANPDVSDPQPSAASRIRFCRTTFSQVCLWDKPEDYDLELVLDRLMHQEEQAILKKLLLFLEKLEMRV